MIGKKPQLIVGFRHEADKYISEVLTPLGLCYSFNIALAHNLMNLNLTTDYFNFQIFLTQALSNRNHSREIPEIPRNDTYYPNGLGLLWTFLFVDESYAINRTGHYLYLHDPYELPSTSSKKIMVNKNRDGYIKIVPQIHQIDNSIAGYDPVE